MHGLEYRFYFIIIINNRYIVVPRRLFSPSNDGLNVILFIHFHHFLTYKSFGTIRQLKVTVMYKTIDRRFMRFDYYRFDGVPLNL